MKKLMIAVAMIALAITTAQAAKFKWGFSASSSTVTEGSKFDGATVYFVLASDLDTYLSTHEKGIDSAADIASLSKSQGTLNYGKMSSTTGNIEVKSSSKPGEWNFSEGNIDWYGFVIDGDSYFETSKMTSVAVGDTATAGNSTFTSKAMLADPANFTKFAGGGDVPEPTTGLLMLVGLAGLALRRRRA